MVARLTSKVVVITGGGTGIGRAVARRAVSEGAAVVIGGRRRDVGEEAAGQLRSGGGRAVFAAVDVAEGRARSTWSRWRWLSSADWTGRSTTPAA
jgi:NAD(P)-dependent dehydrogenase (short-subunit alcohol dehydrogenase family)